MAKDVDNQVMPGAQFPNVQAKRVLTAARGYWALREAHGDGSDEEVAALADLLEVARLAFISTYPQEMEDPDNPGNPLPRGLPYEGPDDPARATCPGGKPAKLFGQLMRKITLEKTLLGL